MSEEQPTPESPQPTPVEARPASPPMPDFSRPPQYQPAQWQSTSAVDRIIPTKNVKALLAYYAGVFSIVPCFSPILGPTAIILGTLGLNECKRNPELPGRGHAITGIVIGSIMTFLVLVLAVLIAIGIFASKQPSAIQ